ncbi:hypothetical protein BS47DRAFT_1396466 [Hydnum rufescens UP504]|uniref:Uncharacterized protein n=1 Tax=Hydnum rufescens UP504 TaxID=1448309 RepID=A0A9P6AQ13_9AGAM|nr:hypothetical protein BS47DRAFT_1396466 [Hydnum rufescens UP504]
MRGDKCLEVLIKTILENTALGLTLEYSFFITLILWQCLLLNALVSSLPPFTKGVIVILAIIGISLIIIALVLSGLDQQAMGLGSQPVAALAPLSAPVIPSLPV